MNPLPTPLSRLSQYANFRRIHEEPPVVVTEDHRAVLVIAWAAAREGRFGGKPPFLVRFDAHPDMGERPRPWAYERGQMRDLDSVLAVANDQRHDDGGWVVSAMQFGLVGDVATFHVHGYHRFPGDNDSYDDHRGFRHVLWTLPSLRAILQESPSPRQAILRSRLAAEDRPPLWVDFDLDFATHRDEDGAVSLWSAADWEAAFDGRSGEFLAGLIRDAALVTISTEPEFCGGLFGSGTNAKALKDTFARHGDWFARL